MNRLTGQPGRLEQLRISDLPPWIPTLEGVLQGYPGSCFTLDIKVASAIGPVVDVVRRTGCAARVCVAGAWDGTLAQLAESIGPDLTIAMGWRALSGLVGSPRGRLWPTRAGRVGRFGRPSRSSRAAFAHIPVRLGRVPIFRDALVERARELGVGVIVWTVNDVSTMARLLDAGVDGIITDRPDLLRDVLIKRGQWQAPVTDRQVG